MFWSLFGFVEDLRSLVRVRYVTLALALAPFGLVALWAWWRWGRRVELPGMATAMLGVGAWTLASVALALGAEPTHGMKYSSINATWLTFGLESPALLVVNTLPGLVMGVRAWRAGPRWHVGGEDSVRAVIGIMAAVVAPLLWVDTGGPAPDPAWARAALYAVSGVFAFAGRAAEPRLPTAWIWWWLGIEGAELALTQLCPGHCGSGSNADPFLAWTLIQAIAAEVQRNLWIVALALALSSWMARSWLAFGVGAALLVARAPVWTLLGVSAQLISPV